MTLRPYQQAAVDAAMDWMRKSVDPAVIEAATGAGKSHIIASVAAEIHHMTGKRVLCLAPSAELVMQNFQKYRDAGFSASVYSSSAGRKDLRWPVVFGTPLTVKNKISAFKRKGPEGYALVVLDEAHGITPTVRQIIDQMREGNPRLRVLGLTATPYRLGTGYIYATEPDGRPVGKSETHEPYFMRLLGQITAPALIEQGYLTPPTIGDINAGSYDTHGMETNARGQFDRADVDRAYHGHGRKTAGIVADIVAQSWDREGVLIFAATVRHAEEVLASLPPQLSAIVTGNTPAGERARLLADFKARRLKYLVNVAVLTTGFDAPHIDVVAVLRKTESAGLYQQIIGRGLRLSEGKYDCLVLDYTSNISDHFPDGDIFSPKIRATKGDEQKEMEITCPQCGTKQTAIINGQIASSLKGAFQADEFGYVLDHLGAQVQTEHGPLPGHLKRRCDAIVRTGKNGEHSRCEYRWTSKECLKCGELNDIAARYCTKCKAEIVDPNEKLVGDFRKMKADPHQLQTDEVQSVTETEGISQAGNPTLRLDFVTPWRSFCIWLMREPRTPKQAAELRAYQDACEDSPTGKPSSVTYKKLPSGFYRVLGYNQPADSLPAEVSNAA